MNQIGLYMRIFCGPVVHGDNIGQGLWCQMQNVQIDVKILESIANPPANLNPIQGRLLIFKVVLSNITIDLET